MRYLLKALAVALTLLTTPLEADDHPQIHYIGFNAFAADKAKSSAAFDAYMEKLKPIMSRYGMTVEAYNVVHGGSDALKADVVTFGTAKDQASFQAFFQDADFQAIFPMLLGALSDHQVVFAGGAFTPHHAPEDTHMLLSAGWIEGDAEAGKRQIAALNADIKPTTQKYDARILAEALGVYSNQGLGAEVKDTTPPHHLELWSIRDAHGLFDDPVMKTHGKALKNLLSRSEDFWLVKRGLEAGHH